MGIAPVGVGEMVKFRPDWTVHVPLAVIQGAGVFVMGRLFDAFNLFEDATWRDSAQFGAAVAAGLLVFYTAHDGWDWIVERRRSRAG